MREFILIKRGYLQISSASKNYVYLNAKLLNNFGVVVDKPETLNERNVATVSEFFGVDIPKGFYSNPQHLKYFTVEELCFEQFISYLQIAINGNFCLDEDVFKRVEVFQKVLPEYQQGKEIKLRKFSMITKEKADELLLNLANDLCKYTRPWSVYEFTEFKWLYLNGYYKNQYLLCRDNAIEMFLEYKNANFAKMLDKKDVVKLSTEKFGYKEKLVISDDYKIILEVAIKNAKDCPMSLKQAKYFNTLLKKFGETQNFVDNSKSPYKEAINLIKQNKILDAAKVFAKNGSLLERNLVFLLSRANFQEAAEIINLIDVKNPIVLTQLLQGILNDEYNSKRYFVFYNNHRIKFHEETDKEFYFRKSKLSVGTKRFLAKTLEQKIQEYYSSKPSLGKIYISKNFKKVGLPLNTSAMGMGLDVLPTGSRLKIKAEYIRTFCYWHDAFDIDTSVIFVNEKGQRYRSYWGNFSLRQFGEKSLCSGDNRNKDGAEYYDYDIKELKELGFKYAIYAVYGYGSTLDSGSIYCGYQNKTNLETQAWDAKNIELKIHVKGKSRGYIGFALDLSTNEVIILNQILATDSQVVDTNIVDSVQKYLNKDYLKTFNMYKVLCYCGEVVNTPEEADIVFDEHYTPTKNQQLIKPFDIEKLVNLLK